VDDSTDPFNLFGRSKKEILKLNAEFERKELSGDWSEYELKIMAKKREIEIKIIMELDTLTSIERKYLLQSMQATETVDAFLNDLDELTQLPPETLAQVAESAKTKFRAGRREWVRKFWAENGEKIVEDRLKRKRQQKGTTHDK
jgi:hypothetical protein